MAVYQPILPADFTVGNPITQNLFDKIANNLQCHEDEINDLTNLAKKVDVFNVTNISVSSSAATNALLIYRAAFDFNLLDARISIFDVGTKTGTLEYDVQKNSTLDPVGMTSVFTTRPSIDFGTASDYDVSNNAVFDAGQTSVTAGDYIRLLVPTLPSGSDKTFHFHLIGEV